LIEELESAQAGAEQGEQEAWHHLVARVVAEVRTSQAIAAAQQEAIGFLERARSTLAIFPDSIWKESLVGLCDFVIQRSY
jgi:octaprenyl-diphosphate synthase